MSMLFSPYCLGPVQLSNRIVIAPMCQYACDNGMAGDWHMIHLGQLALSGAAMLMIEASAVAPEGRISARDLGIWSDQHAAALAGVIHAIRKVAPIRLAIQLAHAGRKASTTVPWQGGTQLAPDAGGWQTIAPSAIAHSPGEVAPLELDAHGMRHVLDSFVDAARRSHALGLDAIEIHGAHGYLLHQFLSPLSNCRSDAYGGSPDNRMRFPLEVFEAVRAAVPSTMAVGMRISATDWVEGGWDLQQSVCFAERLKLAGAHFIHVSSGGISAQQSIPVGPGYQIGFAERIRQASAMPTIGVGLITEAAQAETIIASGQADLVALARAMLYDPRWPWHAAAQLGAQVEAPPQYWRALPREAKDVFGKH
jgi:2,4-dienoyl-CoA reductase-like NADH-dependent reductase (Old Yellow Enzyme family)